MVVLDISPQIRSFIKGLEKPAVAKTLRLLLLLREYGSNLREPYTKKLTGRLFELRVRGRQEIRFIYCYWDGKVVVLTAFIKKTQKTPKLEIERAEKEFKALDI